MNCDKLYVGLELKNYKALCALLGETPARSGQGKNYQEKQFKRYFSYERQDGYKLIITEIFENSKPALAKSNSKYVSMIENLLKHILTSNVNLTVSTTKKNWYYILGMCNEKYIELFNCTYNESYIPKELLDDFYIRCQKKFNDIFFSALNSMQKRNLINYSTEWIICVNDSEHIASPEECAQIEGILKSVEEQMGYKPYKLYQLRIYYHLIEMKIYELYGWKFVYKVVTVKYNVAMDNNSTQVVINEIMLDLNDIVIQAINEQAVNYCAKLLIETKLNAEEHEKTKYFGRKKDIDFNNEKEIKVNGLILDSAQYIEQHRTLVNEFIKIHNK